MDIISNSHYKSENSIILENNILRAEFIPEQGGKLVSLIYKPKQYEFLVQRAGDIYKKHKYDGVYVESECSGFDDMFPTIDECYYEDFPWKGVRIPDHGEVWGLSWDCEKQACCLYMSTFGIRLPYKLEKRVFFKAGNTLKIEYCATNNSSFDMDFLWAAHLMLNIKEGTQIIVPESMDKIVTIVSKSGRIGKYGDICTWPEVRNTQGYSPRLDISREKNVTDIEKYYFKDKLREGWCRLKYPDDDLQISFSFPNKEVPYLGILLNESGWEELYNIFIEPCTTPFDRIDVAKLHGICSKLKAKGKYEWYLEIAVKSSPVMV